MSRHTGEFRTIKHSFASETLITPELVELLIENNKHSVTSAWDRYILGEKAYRELKELMGLEED